MANTKALKKKLIVAVPAYNEEKSIKETIINLKRIKTELNKIGYDYKIYIINDGSKDSTEQLAKKAGADKVINHKVNQGLGAAVRTGLDTARRDKADIAIKFDADLQHDPFDIIKLIQPILDNTADVVYGKRFENIEYRMPVIRKTGNIVFTRLMKFLTGWPLEDSQPGIFAVNNDYLSVFYLPGDYNYTQQILLDAYHKGMRFAHVPVKFRKRETGKSFISLKYPFKVLFQILLVLIGIKPMKIFGTFGMILLISATALFVTEMTQWATGLTNKPVVHVNALTGLLLVGLQSLFFGLIAELIVRFNKYSSKN